MSSSQRDCATHRSGRIVADGLRTRLTPQAGDMSYLDPARGAYTCWRLGRVLSFRYFMYNSAISGLCMFRHFAAFSTVVS